MSTRILIQGGQVLTLDPSIGNFEKADVLIEDNKIVAVQPALSVDSAQVIDASRMIVMPGFIDTHRHTWEGILRNIGTDVPLEGEYSYLANVLGRIAPNYRPQDAHIGTLLGALGAINAGITTLLDWSHIQASPDHTDAVVNALQESGIRAVFAYGFPWWGEWEPRQPEWFQGAVAKHFSTRDQLLTVALAPPGPEFTPFELAKAHWELARSVDARLSVHVGVGSAGKHGKLAEMGRAGLLREDTTYIHATTLSDDEVQMIVDTGGTVSLAVPVEMNMGHGMVPIQRFLDRGLQPSLSIDVETNVPSDMFTQMQVAISLQRAFVHEDRLAGKGDVPDAITTRDVLNWATVEGARANGVDDKVGTLTPGKEADVITLRTDTINILPVNDPIGAIVMGMDTSNVDTVLIGGKIRKQHGELVGVDLARLSAASHEARDHVIHATGFTLPSF